VPVNVASGATHLASLSARNARAVARLGPAGRLHAQHAGRRRPSRRSRLDAARRRRCACFVEEWKRDLIQQQDLRDIDSLGALLSLIDTNRGSSRTPTAGLEPPAAPDEERPLRDLLERNDPSEVATEIAASTWAVITSRADELRRVVSALRQGSDEALFELERDLDARRSD
jgi:hypothetical protein